jgi:phosphatidylglycerol:prolipoprotein diacylglycerol transferase
MHPTLLSIGPLEFHAYTVMMALAFLVGVLLPVRENYKLEKPYPITPVAGLWVYFGALIGARAYWVLQYDDTPIRHLYTALFFWQGGLVFYGGLIGGVLGAVLYLRANRVPILPIADIVLPYLPLAHAIGRIGCLLNGCCWGAPTRLPWGVSYPKSHWGAYAQQLEDKLISSAAPHTLPVHPTQLYEALGLFMIFLVMRHRYKRPHPTGAMMLLYPFLYGVLRFITEMFRGDSARPVFRCTASELIALALALSAGAAYWALVRWRVPSDTPGIGAESPNSAEAN